MKEPTLNSTGQRTRAITASLLSVLLLCCMAATGASAAKGAAAPRPLYWGAIIGSQITGTPPPWDMQAVNDFEASEQKGLSLLQFSAPFADCSASPCADYFFPTLAMQEIREHGAIPFFNWASNSVPTPTNLKEPAFQLSDLISGAYDEYIHDFAEQVREWGHPFFLRFNWEMNGFWFPWSEGVNGNKPGEFVTAWRHVHDIFTEVGATNATWVWCPNVDFTRKLTPLKSLYPGGRYVDWTCLDGFNWGKTSNSGGWMSFNRVFQSTYKRVVKIAPHKPMVIGETAADERGGSKARWIRNMLKVIPTQYRKIRAVMWFDEKEQGMRWPLSSSPAAARAFAEGIGRPVYRPNEFSGIETSPIPPPSWP